MRAFVVPLTPTSAASDEVDSVLDESAPVVEHELAKGGVPAAERDRPSVAGRADVARVCRSGRHVVPAATADVRPAARDAARGDMNEDAAPEPVVGSWVDHLASRSRLEPLEKPTLAGTAVRDRPVPVIPGRVDIPEPTPGVIQVGMPTGHVVVDIVPANPAVDPACGNESGPGHRATLPSPRIGIAHRLTPEAPRPRRHPGSPPDRQLRLPTPVVHHHRPPLRGAG